MLFTRKCPTLFSIHGLSLLHNNATCKLKRFQVAKQGLLHILTVAALSPFITANSGNLVRPGVYDFLVINGCVAMLKHPSRSLVSGEST